MLRIAVLFLVVALVAAALGFGQVANLSWEGTKLFVLVFLVLAILTFVGGSFKNRNLVD